MCDIHGYVYKVGNGKNSYVKISKPTEETSSLIGEAKIDEAKIK